MVIVTSGSCSMTNNNSQGSEVLSNNDKNRSTGDWEPLFFDEFDQEELDKIVLDIKNAQIKKISISYPTKMDELAHQIHAYLVKKANIRIPLKASELKDTDQVKYHLTQVLVILYFD